MNRSHRLCHLIIALLILMAAGCQTSTIQRAAISSEQSRFCEKGLIEYIVGDIPVIISAPHGGRLAPESIPDRTKGALGGDRETDILAREITQALKKLTGGTPHVIICHLKRVKLDCNRNLEQAAQGNPEAERVWHDFHGFIDEAKNAVLETVGEGLYIDLHGHAHPEALLELGYLIDKSKLKYDDDELEKLADASSVRELARRGESSFVELIRGDSSFGALMQRRGYSSVPSPAYPDPGEGKYWRGGYNTARHASRAGGTINGFQIECPIKGYRDTDENRKAFAKDLAESITEYMKIHFKIDIRQPCQ